MPLRSAKMNFRIFGFQRLVWCPKWTPASRSCLRSISCIRSIASTMGFASTALTRTVAREGTPTARPAMSVIRPLGSTPSRSTLRELEPLARAGLTGLLAFELPRIARQETLLAQHATQPLVVADQRSRETETDRARLTRQTTAVHRDLDVESTLMLRDLQRLLSMLLQGETREVLGQRTTVHFPVPGAGAEIHPRHARLAPTHAVILLDRRHPQTSSGRGC